MSSQIDIILRVKDDGSVTLQKAATNVKTLGDAAKDADAKLKSAGAGARSFAQTAGQIDSAGRMARVSLSQISQAARIVGVDLGGIVGPAGMAADALGNIAGMTASLNPLGLALAAVGIAVGAVMVAVDQYNRSIADNIMYTDQYLQNAYIMTAQNRELADSFTRLKQATIESQQISPQWILEHSREFQGLQLTVQALGGHLDTLDDKLAQAKTSFEALSWGATSGYDALERARGAISNLTFATEADTLATANNAFAKMQLADALAIVSANANAYAAQMALEYRIEGELSNAGVQAAKKYKALGEALGQTQPKISAANNAWQQLTQTIKGLVEQALTPTAVTMEDMNAALAGKYIPKWDEFRRRVEAIATGTSIEQFGEQFRRQLEMVQSMFGNLSLDEIAAKFKDFSLFANMGLGDIKSLIDLGPVEAQVGAQVDAIIGKAKLMKAAFDDVWASLSTQKKIDLASALGLDASAGSVEGLKNQIQGAVTGATQGVGDAATQALSSGLTTAATQAGTLATKISTALTPGLNDLNDALTPVNPQLALMNAQMSGILASAQGIKPALDGDMKMFDEWTKAMPNYAASIQALIADALEPLRGALSGIVGELEAIIKKANDAASALAGMGGGAGGGGTGTTPTPAPGFQRGADFIVPPGFPRDSFPMRVTSGERVTVTPAGAPRAVAGGTFVFNVTVDSDARLNALARRVRALAAHGMS